MLEKLKSKNWCRISYFNIAFYASIMWFWWLTLATKKLEEVYNTQTEIFVYLLYFTLIFFIIVNIIYIIKIFVNFSDVKSDFFHPVKSNFFPWIWKIFLILSIWFFSINIEIARYLWIFWVIWQFIFTIIIFRRWILCEMDIKSMNPLWFLPIVWNMLVPIAWVKLGYIELSWFFFSIWIIMWVVLFTIIMNRIIFHNPLPNKLFPTLIILIAPPSVAFLSITSLEWWNITEIWKIFYYFWLFMFIVIATKINILVKINFFMSWWAYSFPIAVLTNATFLLYDKTGYAFLWNLGIFLFIILVLIILVLVYYTVLWAKNRELCVEDF